MGGSSSVPRDCTTTGQVCFYGPVFDLGCTSYSDYVTNTLGLTVTNIDSTTWSSMTTSDFSECDAIVFCDANCQTDESLLGVAENNRNVWSAAVDGNILVIGTDEQDHSASGGLDLIHDGLDYVTDFNDCDKTGLYVSLSCYYVSQSSITISLLDYWGSFIVSDPNTCINDVHIVASHDVLDVITETDASLSNWDCSVHEIFNEYPSSTFTPLAIAENEGISDGTGTSFPDGTFGIPYILANNVEFSGDCCGLEIMFVMDSSGSVGGDDWNKEVAFVEEVIYFGVSSCTNVGAIEFEDNPSLLSGLTDDHNHVIDQINAFEYDGGGTYTYDALLAAMNEFTTNGDSDKNDVIVLVTDGKPSGTDPCELKDDLDAIGIKVVIVAVGSFSSSDIECLVDDITNDILSVDNFDTINGIFDSITDFTQCEIECSINLQPCENEPCTCDELEFCNICHENGCNECETGYFKFNYNHACISCSDTFGEGCMKCQDFDGCGQCDQGYTREYNAYCEVWECIADVPEVTDTPDDCLNDLATDHMDESGCPIACNEIFSTCTCDQLCHCSTCNEGDGCQQCENGYFKKDFSYPCMNCQETFGDGCMFCQDFNGCGQCSNGYQRIYNQDCGLWECELQ